MKTNHLLYLLTKPASTILVLAAFIVITPAQAQTDNFNSGTLDPNWATSVSSNYPGDISFPADPFGGQAIRLAATYSPLSVSGADQDSPRVILWRTDRLYTNFYVAVDVLGWNTSIDRDTNGPYVALFARLTNVVRDPTVPVGRPDCMTLLLNINRFGGTGGGTRGVINVGHLTDGQAVDIFTTLGVQGDCTLDPGHSYRMVFTGTNLLDSTGAATNSVYWGRVYDLQDLTRPLASVTCPDPYPGFGAFSGDPVWEAPGYSGIGSIADGSTRTTDVTFDNFVAAEFPPTSVSFPGTTNGEAGLPQVMNRTPASYTNFYPAAGGISFTATTLGGGNVTSIKLFLNGVDASSGLTIGPLSSSRTVTFPGSGLTSNTVYDARIELANSLGQKTTNIWTFDTFSDAYLASSVCKNIECEDFDFGPGQFIDDPVPSGWLTNVTYYDNFNTVAWPWPGATNQDSASPPYTSYVNKGTPSDLGVDYWDEEGHSGNQVWYADFRPLAQPSGAGQGPGTSEGDPSYVVVDYVGSWFPGETGQNTKYTYDTQRQKYYNLDPVNHAIQEYMLDDLEGGEWYNYTRIFNNSDFYNVYLRHGSEYTMQLRLDQIGPSSTNKLGEFYTTNALMKCNFRYVPLMAQVTPANSLIVNGPFTVNASSFTVAPGYTGGSNPSGITGWTELSGVNACGVNGSRTSVGTPFSPSNPGGLTYAFLQGGDTSVGHVLRQYLTTLAPNTTYQLSYAVAGRTGNTSSYRVVVYSDNTSTTSYYDGGVQPANSSGFATVTASFTTPATLGSAPNIQLGNWSVAGDNTVDYANVFLVQGSGPLTLSKMAMVNLSGTNTLRLTVDVPQEERTKYGLMLNYMVFVPVLLVQSSSQAATGYTTDNMATIEPVTRQITIPKSGATRYYRLSWPGNPVRITSITLTGGNVLLTYQ